MMELFFRMLLVLPLFITVIIIFVTDKKYVNMSVHSIQK